MPTADRDLAVAGVVHDVNQMLTVITGRAELLRLRGVRAGDLEALTLAARDAAAMLRRLGAGDASLAMPARAELARCVDEVVLVHQPPAGAAWSAGGDWVVVKDIAAELAAAVPAQVLREVLGNLVLNAIEAMAGGGRLELAAVPRDGRILLTVQDSGPGLAPGAAERIFAAGGSPRGRDGRGVGLAASRQLLADWDATLGVGEPRAAGAVFLLDLPAAATAESAGAVVPTAAAALPGPILVVDDEPSVREVLAEILGSWGAAVTAAADAGAARTACQGTAFALALVDLNLPGESGLQFARWLRTRPGAPAVVLMTGVDRDAALPDGGAGLCEAVTTKPLDFAGLRQLLAAAVARRSGDDEAEGSQAR